MTKLGQHKGRFTDVNPPVYYLLFLYFEPTMSQQVLGKNVENLTTNVENSNMSKAEADKTIVKGIAHKYEGTIKV